MSTCHWIISELRSSLVSRVPLLPFFLSCSSFCLPFFLFFSFSFSSFLSLFSFLFVAVTGDLFSTECAVCVRVYLSAFWMKHGERPARRSHLRSSECMHYDTVGREIMGGIRCFVLIVLQIIRVIYVSYDFKLPTCSLV